MQDTPPEDRALDENMAFSQLKRLHEPGSGFLASSHWIAL